MGSEYSYARAAVLSSQLPDGSRCARVVSGGHAWGDVECLLSLVEYDLRIMLWQRSKQAEHETEYSGKPISPGDLHAEEKQGDSDKWRSLVDSCLGITDDDGVMADG